MYGYIEMILCTYVYIFMNVYIYIYISHLWDNTEHVKRVTRRDGEYTNNILHRNKFIMTV